MKMRRIVSVWLCVAAVCWYTSDYVDCTESHRDAQSSGSSQDIISDEESREKSHQHKVEENWALPTQSSSGSEQLKEDEEQKEKAEAQEVDQQNYVEVVEVKESTAAVEANKGPLQPEPTSQDQNPQTSSTQDQDLAPLPPSSDSIAGFSAEKKEDLITFNQQDNVPISVSEDESDVAASEVNESELPPANCADEENNPYDGESPPIVLENTSNAHAAGTKSHTDLPLGTPASHGTKHVETNASHMLKEQDLSSPVTTDRDSSVSSKDPEDIPTFDEWKRKMMEVEKEKTITTHTSNNGASHTVKKVQKNFNNYASVECGAKILGSNPEAKSTSAILMENMDLYMLNPCSNKIWFIIELCEPIQLKQLDIANFELFSSTPKDFLVSISDRYPTNKWLKLGTFHARDERTVQSFPLDEHLYAKYVKVELVSHFGSEHFCPLSLIRVFGTSMVEEYDENAEPSERTDDPDDDLDYPGGFAPGEDKLSKNLIGSATDAIMNMVNNIAVNVLGGGPEMQGNLSTQKLNMTETSQQLETTTQTTTTDFTLVPDNEEVELSPVVEDPEPEAPSSETLETETPSTPDGSTEQPHPVEEKIVIPLENDEEEDTGSTIILLDKEEELDEEEKERHHLERQQETLNYCGPDATLSPLCSCAVSLHEYLRRQCSACLTKKRKCQTTREKKAIPPNQTPPWYLPAPPPSACPDPQQHYSQEQEPHEKPQTPEQEPEIVAAVSGTPQPSGNTSESILDAPLLEPSQTVNLPKPSADDPPPATATPIVDTPPPSSEEPAGEPEAAQSQDVLLEEKQMEPSSCLSSSFFVKPTASATVDDAPAPPTEEKSNVETSQQDTSETSYEAPIQIQDKTDSTPSLHPTGLPPLEYHPEPPVLPESSTISPSEDSQPAPDAIPELEPSGGHAVITDLNKEDLTEDISTSPRPSSPTLSSSASTSLSDIYAEPPNGTEQNGNLVHGSSQKESVFMRLNNRIKALEMNMSLSGRYLEQLSQRYRKQMDEMQKAFNKTIIKLQNTSRIAEEQDQRQTESIQLLQGQLENVTQLVLNLSVRVSQLQTEVSDRQNYLLLSLVLCLSLGLLLLANRCRSSNASPTTEPEAAVPKSYTYCCPERQFSSGDETGLKRSASYPLIHSESLLLAPTEGPETLETQSLCPANRKRRRRKLKPLDQVETLKPSFQFAPELRNGAAVCNGVPVITNPTPLAKRLLQPTFRDSPSEGSSEGSSHSDDPSFCGITTACPRICDGLPPPKTRAEKRALRRRRPRSSSAVVDLLHAPRRDNSQLLPISTIEGLMNRKAEQSSGTFMALSGPV